jgi:hypothetical protein
VLKRGGVAVFVTHGAPDQRQPVLERPGGWTLTTLTLRAPAAPRVRACVC